MSSRLLRGENAVVQALAWAPAGVAGEAPCALFPDASAPAAAQPAPEARANREAELAEKHKRELAALRAELEQRARSEREAGRREGEQAGRQQARQELEATLAKLADQIREMAALRERLRLEVEADLVRLSVAIARRILRRELNIDPDAVAGIVHAAFDKLRLQETIRVEAHPAIVEPLRRLLAHGNGSHIEIAADSALAAGAIVFETARGRFDVSVETQLREIERGLTDRLRASGM
jgi:flagellar assembly protein FliH